MKYQLVLFLNCFVFCNVWCKNVAPRIAGGIVAEKRSNFPYQALLSFDGEPVCGASIIDNKHVITAASCLFNTYSEEYSSTYLSVTVGQLNIGDTSQSKQIDKTYIHENYKPAAYASDIAILRISGTFNSWTDNIKPIDLSNVSVTTGSCVVSGWGASISGGILSSVLQHASVTIVNWNSCWTNYYGLVLDDKMICAGGNGANVCQGDSGGPLVCDDNLTGIASFGSGCGTSPHVYTEVSKYIDWIEKTLKTSHADSGSSSSSSLQLSLGVFILCIISKFL